MFNYYIEKLSARSIESIAISLDRCCSRTAVQGSRLMLGCSIPTAAYYSLPGLGKTRVMIKPPGMAEAKMTHNAGGKAIHAANRVQDTAQYTTKFVLGPDTVTQKDGLLPTEDTIKLTLIYPIQGLA